MTYFFTSSLEGFLSNFLLTEICLRLNVIGIAQEQLLKYLSSGTSEILPEETKMAAQCEGGGKDELKTQFATREGTYKLMTLSEYSRPNRVAYSSQSNTPVKASFINLNDPSGSGDRICFNVGRELYFYIYKGVRKAADLTKPIDKRAYKGTCPTCHDFNKLTVTSDSVSLLVGFSAGQIQLIDPIKKELSKLYNEERLIDKTKVTCVKWLPVSSNQFLVAHGSGQLYLYNEELICGPTPPIYQPFKHGDGYEIYTCKSKSSRNPLYRWAIGEGSINEFAFSPDNRHLAIVSQDGFLRIFNYDLMDLVGTTRSYFGGLLCVCWSPDGKYVVTGGEDDLVTVWSFYEKKIVARGQGHKSWVSVVSFDHYTTNLGEIDSMDFNGSDEDVSNQKRNTTNCSGDNLRDASSRSRDSNKTLNDTHLTSYRFGSVGQDTQLCLWDLTEDVIKQPIGRTRTSVLFTQHPSAVPHCNNTPHSSQSNSIPKESTTVPDGNQHSSTISKFSSLTLSDKKDKQDKDSRRNFTLVNRSSDKSNLNKSNNNKILDDTIRLYGTTICPRLDEIPMLEPLICKKIAHERLTALIFREDCFVTACQEGFVSTWARPGKVGLSQQPSTTQQTHTANFNPSANSGSCNAAGNGSSNVSASVLAGGGTVV